MWPLNCDRIGMTLEGAEEILGKPTENAPREFIVMYEGVQESVVDWDPFLPASRHWWVSHDNAIFIAFDERGRVSASYFGFENRPERFLTKLRRWLGW